MAKVFLNGQPVDLTLSEIVLKDPRAERLIRDLPAMDPEQQQLALARATANFKRGDERPVR